LFIATAKKRCLKNKKRNGAEKNMTIRDAKISDAGVLSEIYKYYVDNFSYSFEYTAPSAEEFAKRISGVLSNFPFLVCEDNSEIIGYAYAHQFKERKAYQWVCETSIYIKNDCIQKGAGSMLYAKLLAAVKQQGYVKAYAVLGCPNDGSEIFHKKMGFSLEATLSNIGYKLGSWHDIKYYVIELNPLHGNMPEPLEYKQITRKRVFGVVPL
jgi:phosphinothricin acetyltransferase